MDFGPTIVGEDDGFEGASESINFDFIAGVDFLIPGEGSEVVAVCEELCWLDINLTTDVGCIVVFD